MKLEFFRQLFRKIFKYQISWKSIQWEPSCFMKKYGQIDRYYMANRSFSQFCETRLKRVAQIIYVFIPFSNRSEQTDAPKLFKINIGVGIPSTQGNNT